MAHETRYEEAGDWIVRLQSEDLDEANALAFDAWLSATPENARAYDAALAVAHEFAANAPAVRQGLRERRARPGGRRGLYLAAGSIAAAAAVAVVVIPALKPEPAPQAYVTGVGQHRTVTLEDGTRIDLNASTRLTVALRRGERDVVMGEGQAVFDVAHDARRPFLIAAGDRTVRVVGTQFDVRRRAGRLSVTVTRGLVEVAPSGAGSGQTFRLHPGQRLEHAEGAPLAQVAAATPEEALGWRAGRLVYRDQPLSVVVADLNAQFAHPIRVDDPALAATPISGVLILDGEDAVVRRLALLVSAQAVRSDGGVTLQRMGTPGRE